MNIEDLCANYWAVLGYNSSQLVYKAFPIDENYRNKESKIMPPKINKNNDILTEGFLFNKDGTYINHFLSCGYGSKEGSFKILSQNELEIDGEKRIVKRFVKGEVLEFDYQY